MQVAVSCISVRASRRGAGVTRMNVARVWPVVARIHVMVAMVRPMVARIWVFVTHSSSATTSVATPPAPHAHGRTRVGSSSGHLFHCSDERTLHTRS